MTADRRYQGRALSWLTEQPGMTDDVVAAYLREGGRGCTRDAVGRWRREERGMQAEDVLVLLSRLDPDDAHALVDVLQAQARAEAERSTTTACALDRCLRALPALSGLQHAIHVATADREVTGAELEGLPLREARDVLDELLTLQEASATTGRR